LLLALVDGGSDTMLAAAAAELANHLLAGQPWLRDRLKPFVGSTLELRLPLNTVRLTIAPSGELSVSSRDATPDAVAALSPTAAFELLGGRALSSGIALQGDAAFSSAVAGVLRELRWDVEEDLSRVLGDIAAHRLVGAGIAFLAWQRKAAWNVAATAAEYWTEEQPLLATRSAVDRFVHDVDALRDTLERLEKRIDRLTSP
jgi:ubiquinone biosynthesis protein UbiJ